MTVLGGYLGAGKTTLVNELLAGAVGQRVAVVVNDFGAVNIDADLVRSRSEDTLELSNGCVCCDLADGMAAVMERLRSMDPPPDRVLVEVSGVGNPAAVAGWGDHPGFRRGGVLVCADVETIRDHASDRWVGDTVTGQLTGADMVLVTKTDLVTPERVGEVRRWVADVARGATVIEDRAEVAAMLATGSAPPTPPPDEAGERVDGTSGAHADTHRTWSWTWQGSVDPEELRRLMEALPVEVVRVKGTVRTTGVADTRTLVQVVGRRVQLVDDGPWDAAEGPSKLVVIAAGAPAVGEPGFVTALRRTLG
jgi:G3E family GTPase